MFNLFVFAAITLMGKSVFDETALFNFAAGLVAFLFILVAVLIFVFVYDNLRRGKRASSSSTSSV